MCYSILMINLKISLSNVLTELGARVEPLANSLFSQNVAVGNVETMTISAVNFKYTIVSPLFNQSSNYGQIGLCGFSGDAHELRSGAGCSQY